MTNQISNPNYYINKISNKIASSISKQKDSIIFQVLAENDINIYDLKTLSKNGRFIKHLDDSGKIKHTIFNYSGRDLLIIYEPEIDFKDNKVKCEIKYKKLK